MHTYKEETDQILIEVRPTFIPERSVPNTSCYLYAYTIKVTNFNLEKLKIVRRHWIIRDGLRREERVCAEGVVGERPIIKSNNYFQYTSFCPLPTPTGSMRGIYDVLLNGEIQKIPIPLFFLRPPYTFHK